MSPIAKVTIARRTPRRRQIDDQASTSPPAPRTGDKMPDDTASDLSEAAAVILFTAEDGLADTAARVDAAGGNPELIHVVEATITTSGDSRPRNAGPTCADDIAASSRPSPPPGEARQSSTCSPSTSGANTDMHRDQDISSVSVQLAAMAERTDCAVLLLRHPRRRKRRPGAHRRHVDRHHRRARVGLLAALDARRQQRRPTTGAASSPSANATSPQRGDDGLPTPTELGHLAAHIKWEGTTSRRAQDLAAASQPLRQQRSTRRCGRFVADLSRTARCSSPKWRSV